MAKTIEPMLGRLVRELPEGDYLYEPKWDGFRCLVAREGDDVELWSRHGRPLGRYFPEVAAAVREVEAGSFVLDGELVVLAGGRFDFAALMGRLHPAASRVALLSEETPALLVAFDLLSRDGHPLAREPFVERRRLLEELLGGDRERLRLTPLTDDRRQAAQWLERFSGGGIDGVMAKPRDMPYVPGKRLMLKVKHERTVDCVVAGMRQVAGEPQVASLLLALYDADDELRHVGVASSMTRADRTAIWERLIDLALPLERHPWREGYLLGGGPMGRLRGAAGRWTPDMELDWVPLDPRTVCEVAYTQADGARFRHPARFRRWRPDREPRSCRVDQLDEPAPPPLLGG